MPYRILCNAQKCPKARAGVALTVSRFRLFHEIGMASSSLIRSAHDILSSRAIFLAFSHTSFGIFPRVVVFFSIMYVYNRFIELEEDLLYQPFPILSTKKPPLLEASLVKKFSLTRGTCVLLAQSVLDHLCLSKILFDALFHWPFSVSFADRPSWQEIVFPFPMNAARSLRIIPDEGKLIDLGIVQYSFPNA